MYNIEIEKKIHDYNKEIHLLTFSFCCILIFKFVNKR